MLDLTSIEGFEWDEGNVLKSWTKHKVNYQESEEVFLDRNLAVLTDAPHSEKEERFIALGKTNRGRLLYVAFTVRGIKIRVISARDINRKEKNLYEKAD